MLNSVLYFINQGGITAQLLVAIFFILILLVFERFYVLYFYFPPGDGRGIYQVLGHIYDREYNEAIQYCDVNISNPKFRLIRQSLIASENGREALKSELGSSLASISQTVDARVPFISLIASSATLLGLLGTISGLIKTFSAMTQLDPAQKAVMLGQGISEAMYSTGAGLVVGLIAMVFHSIAKQRSLSLVLDCRRIAYEIVRNIESAERVPKNG